MSGVESRVGPGSISRPAVIFGLSLFVLCLVFPEYSSRSTVFPLNNSASVEELSADGCPQISQGQLSFR